MFQMTKSQETAENNTDIGLGLGCKTGQYCYDGETCCAGDMLRIKFICCPGRNAVCCADYLHCCPEGFVCSVDSTKCIGHNNGGALDISMQALCVALTSSLFFYFAY